MLATRSRYAVASDDTRQPKHPAGRSQHRRRNRGADIKAFMATGNTADDMPAIRVPWYVRLSRWSQTSLREAAHAEQGLLSLISGPKHGLLTSNVRVGPGKQDWLHTISNVPVPEQVLHNPLSKCPSPSIQAEQSAPPTPSTPAPVGPPVVLMPGYGAGSGFFFRNMGDLGRAMRLYCVDWLGTGLSGRPAFTAKTREQAEHFFLDSLATWRQKAGLGDEKMVLVGHSLGGYLAAAYALAYPQHVEHLVLVCPAGVPKAPEDWQEKFLGGRAGWRGTVFKAAMMAWEAGFTPHSLVRGLGPWGPRVCERYISSRFTHHGDGLSEREAHWFKQYFYQIVAQQGSGEYALRHLLAPGAWAHEPLAVRLRELQVPVTFIYGAHDWMRPEHAVQLVQQLKKERKPKVESDLHVEIIEDAGHFVFIDQPLQFNQALLHAIKRYLPGSAAATLRKPSAHSMDSTSWGDAKPSATTY